MYPSWSPFSRSTVKTDDNGKYSYCFVKTVDGGEIRYYDFFCSSSFIEHDTVTGNYFNAYNASLSKESILPILEKSNRRHPQIVTIDTAWAVQKNTRPQVDSNEYTTKFLTLK